MSTSGTGGRWRAAGAAFVVVLASTVCTPAIAGSATDARAPQSAVAEYEATFTVVNKNDSPLPCDSDGKTYELHGHLVGPRTAIGPQASQSSLVSLLLYGWDGGEWNWRFPDRAYDYPYQMALLGQTSLSLDLLGYDTSNDNAPGPLVCMGSMADMIHQVVTDLRSSSYTFDGRAPVGFDHVVVSAHDIAPVPAVIESTTWHDIDGISSQLFAHQGFTPYILSIFTNRGIECAEGGERPDDTKGTVPNGGGYVYFGPPDDQFRSDLFLEPDHATGPGGADPAVIDKVLKLRNRNPCGLVSSTAAAVTLDLARMKAGAMQIPALLVFPGPDDPVITRIGQEQEPANYGHDVTTAWVDSGHFMMLERCAPAFRQLTAHWLHEHWGVGDDVALPAVGAHDCVTELRPPTPELPTTKDHE